MDIEDDLKSIDPKDLELGEIDPAEELKKQKRKRLIIAVISVFLIILFVSYLIVGTRVLNIIAGQFGSTTVEEDFTAELDNGGKVVFSEDVYERLRELYFDEQRNEFKVCLEGSKEGNNYFVTGLTTPVIFSQSFSRVSAEPCDENTIISMHTHPFKSCIFSGQDIRTYEFVREVNPDAIIGLMCEPDRFDFYGY